MKVAEFAIPGSEWAEEIQERGARIRRLSFLLGEGALPNHLIDEHGLSRESYDRADPEWDGQYYAHLRDLRMNAGGIEQITYKCKGGGGHLVTVQYNNLHGDSTPSYFCEIHGIPTTPALPF